MSNNEVKYSPKATLWPYIIKLTLRYSYYSQVLKLSIWL